MKKHLTRLRPLLLVMAAVVFLVQCQAEYLETNPTSNTNSNKARHRILTGASARQKGDLLISTLKANGGLEQLSKKINPNGAAMRTFKDIELYIDYSQVYEVEQKNGITNYTYRVAMPDATETIFYNLVLKQDSHYSKTVLIKYEMRPEFAADYYTYKQDFSTFTGRMSVEVLGIDEGNPCDEEPNIPIPISGGSGPGASGGGPGGGGSGGGGSGSGGGGTNPGYTYNQDMVNAQYMALAITSSQVTTDPNGGGEDGGGEDDEDGGEPWFDRSKSPRGHGWRTGVINDPVLEDPSNPCDDEEEIGILDPVNILIDTDFREDYPCQTEIIEDAYSVCSNLNEIFLAQFNSNDTYNLTYKNAQDLQSGGQYVNAATSPGMTATDNAGNKSYHFDITFDNGYLNTATDLSIARTAIHENLHAILFYLNKTEAFSIITENPTYAELLEAYCNMLVQSGDIPFMPISNIPQHSFMAQFVGDIADTLKTYAVSKGYNLPDSYYNAMAWGGLTDTAAFEELYAPNNTLTIEGEYILGTIIAEKTNANAINTFSNLPFLDQSGNPIVPLSSKCQN